MRRIRRWRKMTWPKASSRTVALVLAGAIVGASPGPSAATATLTQLQARKATKDKMTNVAVGIADAYRAGVLTCKRSSAVKFRCVGYLYVEGHIRCTQPVTVTKAADGIGASLGPGKSVCKASTAAPY